MAIKILLGLVVLIGTFLVGAAAGVFMGVSINNPKIPTYNYSLWKTIQRNKGQYIDFQAMGNDKWTRVCFLGPYNENSEKLLGFPWHITDYTNVLNSDGHNVIIFATDTEVVDFIIQTRSNGDFYTMSGRCLPRNNSKLVLRKNAGDFAQ